MTARQNPASDRMAGATARRPDPGAQPGQADAGAVIRATAASEAVTSAVIEQLRQGPD